jgi:hypothetical protein
VPRWFCQALEDIKKRVGSSKRSNGKDCRKKEETGNIFRDRMLLLLSPQSFKKPSLI